jgi:hypothetical protein
MHIKKTLLALGLALTCGAYTSMAQIEVKVRPERPHYVRTERPGPHHVWIDEEWEPRGNSYVFTGGRWAEPPHAHARWTPGHWKDTPRGHMWKPGHWK